MTAKTNLLTDVVIIRPILVVLLVFYHAFAIYSGIWTPIEGFPEVRVYWWLDKLSYAFMLETFVFVSGYVFGYQVRTKGVSKLNAKDLFVGKLKRLMVPCMFFSLLYIILFLDINQPIYKTMYEMVDGVAHMWFLPMLFWCFVGIWIIEKIHVKQQWVLLILLLSSIVSIVNLPLQLGQTMYYMLFFYVGYIIQRRAIDLTKLESQKMTFVLSLAFLVLFATLTLLNEKVGTILGGDNQVIMKILRLFVKRNCQFLYSSVGVLMILSIIRFFLTKTNISISHQIVDFGNLCMGIYLIQQFILKGLYNYTELPMVLGCYILPWFGFIMAMLLSYLCSLLLNRTKGGRLILGC